jgi:hypothetical protein
VEVHSGAGSPDLPAPAGGSLVAYARRSGDGWRITHRDGRAVTVSSAVEVLERMLMISDHDGPVDAVLLVAPRPS